MPLLIGLLAWPPMLFAHRLDEYLQASMVTIEPDHVQLQITLQPGTNVATQVLAQVDQNHDQKISRQEAAAYIEALQRDISLRIDGRLASLKPVKSDFATPAELRSGSGIILLEFSAPLNALSSGAHRLTFENRHQRSLSVYLFNAVLPKSKAIQIRHQERIADQSTGEIDFVFQP